MNRQSYRPRSVASGEVFTRQRRTIVSFLTFQMSDDEIFITAHRLGCWREGFIIALNRSNK